MVIWCSAGLYKGYFCRYHKRYQRKEDIDESNRCVFVAARGRDQHRRIGAAFEGQHNGTYEGAYTVSLDMPEQAGMDIRNSSAALAEEGKKTAFVLKHDTVIAVIGYRETIRE